MSFILGKKLNMDTAFKSDGQAVAVTKIQAGSCQVVQIKTADKEGYQAIQLGYGKKKKLTKQMAGHLKGLPNFAFLREFKVAKTEDYKKGQEIKAELFKPGDLVQVSGVSKGKGFQGVVRRHGFHGSPATHGHKDQLRMPGSIGATGPQKVFKGTKLPGRMGGDRATVKNLEVIEVDKEKNELVIKGAIPGARNGLLLIIKTGEAKQLPVEEVAEEKKPAKGGKDDKKPETKPVAKEAKATPAGK
ncbi:50S ribosomal protein L3 [Patescibacteria group bacterium]|nr:50S ribosomal protein L3 [Patescibacteria group bacterium]